MTVAAVSAQGQGLERLWAGGMGSVYAATHGEDAACRAGLWAAVAQRTGRPQRVLEVGCNSGQNLRHWAALDAAPEELAGVDVNAAACAAARLVEGVSAVHCASAYALPFPAASFDLAFCAGMLIHLPPDDAAGAVRELVRVVRPGGHVALLEQESTTPGSGHVARTERWYGLRHGLWRHPLNALLACAAPELVVAFAARGPSCGGAGCQCAAGGVLALLLLRKPGVTVEEAAWAA